MSKLICGDCLEVLAGLEHNSIDTIITDPPYGLRFMGKRWDYDVPDVATWKACLRVLKPGGTLLCFAGTRTQHRMAVNIEDAGFLLKDCLMWLYGSGFPKATDISKQLDKKAGAEREMVGRKSIAYSDSACWGTPNKNVSLGKTMFQSGERDMAGGTVPITAPTTEDAKLWNGWKSHGLKPAYEPILVAMKPNESTYAQNALDWGVSGLWIDGARVPTNGENYVCTQGTMPQPGDWGNKSNEGGIPFQSAMHHQGRYPANLILECNCGAGQGGKHAEDCVCGMLDRQSGISTSVQMRGRRSSKGISIFGSFYGQDSVVQGHNDTGGASRFFYCAKASKRERNEGLGGMEKHPKKMVYGNGLNSATKCDPRIHTPEGVAKRPPTQNFHPTVKPLALMEYLCTLTRTPTGGIVLDLFMGSGTTGIACVNTDRSFMGIEVDEDYFVIAQKRIAYAQSILGQPVKRTHKRVKKESKAFDVPIF